MTGHRIHGQDSDVVIVGRPVMTGRDHEVVHADQAQDYQGDDPDHKRTSRHAAHYVSGRACRLVQALAT
jgi:hypothetical protein